MGIGVVELVVAALAVWQVVEIWHHSSIMAPLRARVENLDVDGGCGEGKLRELLTCPFCLSVWVGFLVGLVVLLALPAVTWGEAAWGAAGFFIAVAGLIATLGFLALAGTVSDWRRKKKTYRWVGWVGEVAAYVALVALYVVVVVGVYRAVPGHLLLDMWFWVLGAAKLAVFGFALSRAANLGNDLTRKWCRTPQVNKLDHTGDGDDDTTPPGAKEPRPFVIKLEVPDPIPVSVSPAVPKTAFEKKADDGPTTNGQPHPEPAGWTTERAG